MRFTRITVVLAAAALSGGLVLPASAEASPQAKAKPARAFANCTQMHKVYKGGVAKAGAKDKRKNGGHARYAPVVSTAIYNANKKSDADHDGVACEQ